MANLGNFVSDDELAAALLRDRGSLVDFLPWDQPADWSAYDLVVIRTTWDYHERPIQFLEVLAEIEQSDTRLHNPLSLVRWNLDKTYLRDLESVGVPIVPTLYGKNLASSDELATCFNILDAEELILKPPVNVNAFHTFRVSGSACESLFPELKAIFGERPFMAQPFMPAIATEGEYSLIYFNGQFSHAILKKPQAGDFRVQEEHGGQISPVRAWKSLRAAGKRAVDALPGRPLYARVDLVRGGDLLVMELELIEPSLYLRMHPAAPKRFADVLTAVAAGAGNMTIDFS
jgi:glutathione synthase/RimK-type ligase-like ATP-grasp enzyme